MFAPNTTFGNLIRLTVDLDLAFLILDTPAGLVQTEFSSLAIAVNAPPIAVGLIG